MPAPVPKERGGRPRPVQAGEEGADADREVRVTGVGVEIPDRAPRAGSEMLR